jgi:uncharacterized protein
MGAAGGPLFVSRNRFRSSSVQRIHMTIETTVTTCAIAGFIAQLIDGVMGMGYGVGANTFLLALGMPPAAASASVHASEVFTSGVSGISHLSFRNVDMQLLKRLVIPGVVGGVCGAYLLTTIPAHTIKPLVSVYLLLMGCVIVERAVRGKHVQDKKARYAIPLALVGGFLDAVGGGGWGPVVTTSLVADGAPPRSTIGSVNLAEFFVTLAQSITFVLTIGLTNWQVIVGLLLGGVIAAPLGAWLCTRLPHRPWAIGVGVLIVGLSIRTLVIAVRGS